MKITRIDCHVLLVPEFHTEACSSAQDDLVVEIHTDEGIVGIGETDVNPWIARACIKAMGTHIMGLGLEEMLIGEDPMQPEAIWQKLYSGSKMNGRRGALICAMGAIDMALWDIKGKSLGLPIYKLLGGAVKDSITYPMHRCCRSATRLQEYRDSLKAKLLQAREFGFKAAKLEICINGPYTHNALQEDDDHIAGIVAECRDAVGSEMTLMVDVAYAWDDARTALRVIKQLEPLRPLLPRDAHQY